MRTANEIRLDILYHTNQRNAIDEEIYEEFKKVAPDPDVVKSKRELSMEFTSKIHELNKELSDVKSNTENS